MYAEQQDVYYYLTVLNENYTQPAMPKHAPDGIVRGMYLFRRAEGGKKAPRVQLLGSGSIFREVIAAADLLHADFGVEADLWACPSFTELGREARGTARWNLLHPAETPKRSYVERLLGEMEGPVVAATDYIRAYADQIRAYVPRRYVVLGTDGFGRSDTREKLRSFFEVDRFHVAVAALKALADEGTVPVKKVSEAIEKYGVDANRPAPWSV
jgi:pyruvate dehydrogenase E1 component